jgi:catechol 2,3-dioxygenase-like lactoylglutathione lyase family enzyme
MKTPRITETNITLMVKNMDKSVLFYHGLGFKLKQRWENHYAMLSTKGLTIGLHPGEGRKHHSGTVSVGMMVEKIESARALLEHHKIKYDYAEGKSGKHLNFKDPDGTALYFVEPRWR